MVGNKGLEIDFTKRAVYVELMSIVEDKIYYHIHRGSSPFWVTGGKFFFGRSPNIFFSHFDTMQPDNQAKLYQENLLLIRELIFEEVRNAMFPQLPSRQRCIWLIPDNPAAVKYWWSTMAGPKKIFQLSVSGKYHVANQSFLKIDSGPYNLNAWKERAFRYWAGIKGADAIEDEVLFEGFVNTLEEVPPSTFGLPSSQP